MIGLVMSLSCPFSPSGMRKAEMLIEVFEIDLIQYMPSIHNCNYPGYYPTDRNFTTDRDFIDLSPTYHSTIPRL